MKLSVLFKKIQHAVIQMPELEEEMEIRGITCNSQKAEEDSLFVCIQGSRGMQGIFHEDHILLPYDVRTVHRSHLLLLGEGC